MIQSQRHHRRGGLGGCKHEGKIQHLDEGFSVSKLFDADAEAFTVFFGLFRIFAKMTLMTESSAR